MTRGEALGWYRQGFAAGLAVRDRQALDEHQAAVAAFRAEHDADELAAIGALIAEVVDVLAQALGEPGSCEAA